MTRMKLRPDLYDMYHRGGAIDYLGNIRRMPFIHRAVSRFAHHL
jgi:hypothetical protein